nr:PTS sugar transporter subunit IIA [uncultured Rhodopila sp.]
MDIADFLTPDRIVLDAKLRDKSQFVTETARLFASLDPALQPASVETALRARERLGSTGLGGGFALPHARIEGLEEYAGLFLRLAKPIDFDAIDGKPIDLAFVLLIPFETTTPHVAALAAISRKFRDAALAAKLRKVGTQTAAYEALTAE